MDLIQQNLERLIAFLGDGERQGAIALIGTAVVAIVGALWMVWQARRNAPAEDSTTNPVNLISDSAGEIRLTIEEYDRRLRSQKLEIEERIIHAQAAARPTLEAQLEELKSRISDIEPAYQNAVKKIRELETALNQSSPDVSDERLAAAVHALENGEYTLANQIFIEVDA